MFRTSSKFGVHRTDVCIAGAGVIGLSIALELQACGLNVVVLDSGEPMREASTAAAGMLAADDPHNPPELSALSHLSIALYPDFLDRIAGLSGIAVPFQTTHTIQAVSDFADSHDPPIFSPSLQSLALKRSPADEQAPPPGTETLQEHSIDPRQLAPSLLAAIAETSVELLAYEPVVTTQPNPDHVKISTPARTIEADHFIDCTGAWANDPAYSVVPIKGQMLAVSLAEDFRLQMTVRTPDIYIVPRNLGPNAGRAIIGATIEDAGFDKTVHAAQIDMLHRRASALLPSLAQATVLESWAGLRPATPDRLPLLGAHPAKARHWVATGHYRNGILLAPATAHIMAQLILGQDPSISLEAFSPARAALLQTR